MTTLRGVFPEPKVPPKRNFVLENKREVKKTEQAQVLESRESKRSGHSGKQISQKSAMPKQNISTKTSTSKTTKPKTVTKGGGKSKNPSESETFTRDVSVADSTIKSFRSLGVQTVDDATILSKTDCVLYAKSSNQPPTSRIRKTTFFKSSTLTPSRTLTNNERSENRSMQKTSSSSGSSEDEKEDLQVKHTKQGNIGKMSGDTNLRQFKETHARSLNVIKGPEDKPLFGPEKNEKNDTPEKSTDKKGNQKYQRDKKKNTNQLQVTEEEDNNCPEGHVALPENERKETLGVLRTRFAELVSELNKMPVRTDTLRIKKRKMELEQELCKLEEGIKVFSRHRVYVKVNV